MISRPLRPVHKILSILLLTLTSFLVVNNAYFVHTHRTETGQLIFHAHPYGENGNKTDGHRHSDSGLIHIQLLQSATLLANQTCPQPNIHFLHNVGTDHSSGSQQVHVWHSQGRAPPSTL
ncbi:MAG: hypothetical protein PHQ26_06750 [Bacteroidales bacterium]|nr:hypothetical protein [Bacteroidales bacterium]MDD4771158.1 hypothetical protein [Bacteroidales bacterium]HKL91724.1 hypothetical protein [Bacteroidales bacterium]